MAPTYSPATGFIGCSSWRDFVLAFNQYTYAKEAACTRSRLTDAQDADARRTACHPSAPAIRSIPNLSTR